MNRRRQKSRSRPTGHQGTYRCFGLLATAIVGLVAGGCGVFGEHSKLAMSTFNDVYLTEGTTLDDCSVCHSGRRALNPYGQAVDDQILKGIDPDTDEEKIELLRNALIGVEALDSDGDGQANDREIMARTRPGDGLDR